MKICSDMAIIPPYLKSRVCAKGDRRRHSHSEIGEIALWSRGGETKGEVHADRGTMVSESRHATKGGELREQPMNGLG